MNRVPVVIICEEQSRIEGMIEMASMLQDIIEPTFILPKTSSIKIIEKVTNLKQRLDLYDFGTKNILSEKIHAIQKLGAIKIFIRNNSLTQLIEAILLFIKFVKYINIANKLIKKNQPKLIFISSDRLGISLTNALFWCNKRNGNIPSIIPYLSIISNGVAIRKVEKQAIKNKSLITKFLKKHLIPQNWKNENNQELQFYSTATALTLYLFGVFNKNPWTMGQGESTVTCIDTELSLLEMKEGNPSIKENKYKIVGSAYLEKLLTISLNENTIEDNKYIIIAAPQFYEQGLMCLEDHKNSIEQIIEPLSKLTTDVILSLHPRMDPITYKYLEKKYSIKISKEPLIEILHNSKIFIAINSSTIIWSTLLGIKTIFLDCYGIPAGQLNKLNSVIKIKSFPDYVKLANNNFNVDVSINYSDDWKLLGRESLIDFGTKKMHVHLINELSIHSY